MPAGEPAMDVVTGRVVRDASGKVIRSERITTHYEPLVQEVGDGGWGLQRCAAQIIISKQECRCS